jgi:hypothetical protein
VSVKRAAAKKVSRAPAEPAVQVAVCVVPGCERPVLHRGLCPAHWESPQRDLADDN